MHGDSAAGCSAMEHEDNGRRLALACMGNIDKVLPLSFPDLNFPPFEPSRNRTIFRPFTHLPNRLTLTRIDLLARFPVLLLRLISP
jgi:hypothetical protein